MRPTLVLISLLFIAGCASLGQNAGSGASATATPAGSPLAPASGLLAAQVSMPPNFPADVPIYPHARLTSGASFASSGELTWGMEWESLDGVASVLDFYTKQFNSADWTMTLSASTATSFSATVVRKSNSRFTGVLTANSSSGLTKIQLALVSPA